MSKPIIPESVVREPWMTDDLYTAVKELAPDGRISCSQAHDFAHLHSIELGKMRLLLDACCIRLKGCQLGCF